MFYRNNKSGVLYNTINLNVVDATNNREGNGPVVLYVDVDRNFYVRDREEFMTKFQEVTAISGHNLEEIYAFTESLDVQARAKDVFNHDQDIELYKGIMKGVDERVFRKEIQGDWDGTFDINQDEEVKESTSFECKVCGMGFIDDEALYQHYDETHNKDIV